MDTSYVFDFRIAEAHDQSGIMIVGNFEHFSGFGGKFIKYLGRITHDDCTKAVGVAKEFKIGSSDVAVRFVILCPLSCRFCVSDKKMGGAAK